MPEKEVRLKVAEAVQDDVNKGIVKIDSSFMHQIEVRPGDIVEIEGERRTVGIADRAYPGDIGLNIIRMDGIIRRNAKTGIGDVIRVSKADVKEAKKVIIAPARKDVMIRASSEIFKQGLLGRALLKGDIVALGGSVRRRSTMANSPFEDIFRMLDEGEGMGFGFGDLKFIVVDTLPKQAVIVTDVTEVVFNPEAQEVTEERPFEVTYEDIGGLSEEIKKVREMVELPLKHPEIFEKLGIEPPKGVLLHGPPGTGKTLLAKAVANETQSNFILINGPEIMSKYYGQSEQNLRKKFEEAEKNAPSIIFIDEIDAIASKREEVHGEVERRVVAQLLTLMDGLKSRGKVVVIAASNVPNLLDPALRRPGRFDREIELAAPSKEGRLDVLKIHTRNMPLWKINAILAEAKDIPKEYKSGIRAIMDSEKDKEEFNVRNINSRISKYFKGNPTEDLKKLNLADINKYFRQVVTDPRIVHLDEIAQVTHGFVGADLSSLAKETAMIVLRRVLPELKLQADEPIPPEILDKLMITHGDFKEALKVVRPSAMREVLIEIPNIHWADIGGLDPVKQELKEAVEWPIKNPESFRRLGVKPPKGILLYGPPGTGKTLLAKAVATESEANFIQIKGPELLSKWLGESEKAVREIFKKARQTSPTIIFFDELDSLVPKRGLSADSHVTERVVNQMLAEIDGLEGLEDVVILGATNRPDMIDSALLRPGRFDRLIMTPAPDEVTRFEIFKVHTKGMPISLEAKSRKAEAKAGKVRPADKQAEPEAKAETSIFSNDELKGIKSLEDFLKLLARKTEGYSGADIEAVCREAAILSLRKDIETREVAMTAFEEALAKVRPSVTKDIEETYRNFENFARQGVAKQMKEEKPSYMG